MITFTRLTNEEANLLEAITSRNRMDCWFYLMCHRTIPEHYVVRDLESGRNITVFYAMQQIIEALNDQMFATTSEEEWKKFFDIYNRLKANLPRAKREWRQTLHE